MYNLKDTYKTLHPKGKEFSRYYSSKDSSSGATRLDRIYLSKHQTPTFPKYLPNPFSDHYCYITKIKTDDFSQKSFIPKPKPSFKIHPKIVDDPEFQNEIKLKLDKWTATKNKFNYNTVDWWESVVKPGIKNIAITFTRSHNKSKYRELNMLYLKQKYFLNKVNEGNTEVLTNLNLINLEIK